MKALSAAKIEKMSPLEYTAYLMAKNAKMDYDMTLEYAEKKGMEKGMEKEKINNIKKLLQLGTLTIEEIATVFDVPFPYVLAIKKKVALNINDN